MKSKDFVIVDDEEMDQKGPISKENGYWKILVVDDDDEVHSATKFALKNVLIENQPLHLLHCYNATEALELLRKHDHIAVALIDVVMETPDAGLKLVEQIRNNQDHENLRIVLRTGQPGYAPELTVITQYDINAYLNKSELTNTRLLSTLITATRSFHQLEIIHRSRQGLEIVVGSAVDLFNRSNLQLLAQGILTQLLSLLGRHAHGFVSLYKPTTQAHENNSIVEPDSLSLYEVVVATEPFENSIGRSIDNAGLANIEGIFEAALNREPFDSRKKELGLHFLSRQGTRLFVYIDTLHAPFPNFIGLLKLFSKNISVAFDNLTLMERLDSLAFLDPVFRLPNRNAFEIEYQNLQDKNIDFIFFRVRLESLDRHISALGPSITDKVIVHIKENLESNLPISPYFIGFDGKSDFYILAPTNFDPKDINKIIQAKILLDNVELQVTIRIAAVYPLKLVSSQNALRRSIATIVQYQGKILESNILQYTAVMSDDIAHRLSLNSSLYSAIEQEKGIDVYFQPKVSLSDRKIIAAEALCRWSHDGKTIRPDVFIALAEESGLINRLTDLVIKLVGKFVKSRADQSLSTPPIAINLSIYDLRVDDAAYKLQQKFLAVGLSNTTLELEVTESCMIDDTFHVIRQLSLLRSFGYKIALDDFGTGYSSLGHLNSLPIDYVKMDKVFVDNINLLNVKGSIVSLAVGLSSTMGFKVIAEGVETTAQEEALMAIGCHMCQGYLYSKPLPATEFSKFLAS